MKALTDNKLTMPYHALKQKIQALDNTATTRMPPLTRRTNFVASRMALDAIYL
jgi:hypothetical protein